MATVTQQELMTLEQYALLPDCGVPTELVKGKVITLNQPTPRHGQVCMQIGWLFTTFVKERQLGRLVSNDSAIVTHRNPDSVRGADLAFYSSVKLPGSQLPKGFLQVAPELVIEVRSPSDRWTEILEKTTEYLKAGVAIVCVVDPEPQTVHIFRPEQAVQLLNEDQEFHLPDLFPDFRVLVRKFFE